MIKNDFQKTIEVISSTVALLLDRKVEDEFIQGMLNDIKIICFKRLERTFKTPLD